MFDKKTFANRLSYLRKEKAINQKALADFLGVTITQVSDMERARRTTTIEKLYQLSDYFNVSADYLLGLSDNPEINK